MTGEGHRPEHQPAQAKEEQSAQKRDENTYRVKVQPAFHQHRIEDILDGTDQEAAQDSHTESFSPPALQREISRRPRQLAIGAGPVRLCRRLFLFLSAPDRGGRRLLLFGAVQTTMIGYGIWSGERMRVAADSRPGTGVRRAHRAAVARIVGAAIDGRAADARRGRCLGYLFPARPRGGDSLKVTAGNFARTVPMALALSLLLAAHTSLDREGSRLCVSLGCGDFGRGLCHLVYGTARTQIDHRRDRATERPHSCRAGRCLLSG